MARLSGVLAHPTSFPGPHGIGDLGAGAFRFIDWLTLAGQHLWQVLPLNPSGPGHSPYASPSTFAGNPLLISLPALWAAGLLDESDATGNPGFPPHEVDFYRAAAHKFPLLRQAFDRFRRGAAPDQRPELELFKTEQAYWLDDYALFMALKDTHGGTAWMDWESPLAMRDPDALAFARERLAAEIAFHQFVQFQFWSQWRAVRSYANEREIRIVGDLPIFVAQDSADVWAHRDLFRLRPDGRAAFVAGVPPDAFTEHGQLWGNPQYDWPANAADGYAWWIARVRAVLVMVDLVRIDHFRGFAASWVIPADAATAASGRWEKGPGEALFAAMRAALGGLPFIAEDLGVITLDVVALRDELNLPGMKVLQFAFGDTPANPYLPHNYEPNCVVYPGTHDNPTTITWFAALPPHERQAVQRYLGRDGSDIAWDFIRLALASTADTAILPLQDIMRLGSEARMNTPGLGLGNWGWRFADHQLHAGLGAGLAELAAAYGRRPRREGERSYDPYDYTAPDTAHPLHETGGD
ncbi:MAG: 4-alpha-glucanotransferase [Thermomicrobiales bacterium]|nr:4-alpha-glucanotransferase [Thermomicrobiales bacterium]